MRGRGSTVTTRRKFIGTVAAALLSAPLAAEAQQPGKIHRIGVLSPDSPGPLPFLDAFRQELGKLGYVENQNIAIEYRFAGEKPELLPKLAAELVRLKVDVILAINTAAAQAAKSTTKTIPIVFTYVAEAGDLVPSLAQPGGNVTGLTTLAAELSAKRLGLLKDALPGISRVAFLWNSANLIGTRGFKETERAGLPLGIRVHPMGFKGRDGLQDAFKEAGRERVGALFVWEDAVLLQQRARVLELAAKHRLPAMAQYRGFVEAGGLLSYGPDLSDHFRRAATYVGKILKGAKPADLPVEQPTKFELAINLKTAKALGLTIPPSLLQRADEVIQ